MNEKHRALWRAIVTLVLVFSLTSEVDASNITDIRNNPAGFLQSPNLFSNNLSSASLQPATAVSAGYIHTCALTAAGGVMCWGDNTYGQLGDGTTLSRSTPVDVSGLTSGVSAVSAGSSHTCALMSSGNVMCWGSNAYGQLGDKTNTDHSTPVQVTNLSDDFIAVVSGFFHTCALTTAGGVMCWGENAAGQLGDGTSTARNTPVAVSELSSGVTAITAGGWHTCALITSGEVKCWGNNSDGQLGNGTTTYSTKPVNVLDLPGGISAISSGGFHTCALTASDGVMCWGSNEYGQLGDGSTYYYKTSPVDVSGLTSGVRAVSAGISHTCALTTSGGVKCWGYNYSGQLGDGSRTDHSTPMDVSGLTSGVSAVSAGTFHTCALTSFGGIKCWGSNLYGQLGDGTTTNQTVPVDVSWLSSGVNMVSAGSTRTCALTASGGVKCWGWNLNGQLGDGTTSDRSIPGDVTELTSGVSAISAGAEHACALTSSGGVKCWGMNTYGQLGDESTTDSSIPVDVFELDSGISAVSAGDYHTCALTDSGGVKCWGWNGSGQLGDGTTTNSSIPVNVNGLSSGVILVSAGGEHTCALTDSGVVKCWGKNTQGQLGNETTTDSHTPVEVSGLTSVVSVMSAGGYHTCAITLSGGLKCWGDNSYGQLGDGTIVESHIPVDVSGLASEVSAVSAGRDLTCAVTTSGGAKCWGDNLFGRLGDGTTEYSPIPVDVSGLSSGISAVSLGFFHTCALTTSGGVKCWGLNFYGELGWKQLWVPVDVMGFGEGGEVFKVMLPLIQR